MSEETLPGGNTDGAVLIGDVVHKRAAPWTPTVHALLRHLEQAGVDGVPRALGFDEQGRQMLTYLPGEVIGDRVPWPAWAYTDSTLVQVGQWMRRVHDATAAFMPPQDERWFTGRTMQPGWIIGHQDAAPYNAVMDGDRLAGFFDWDTASPSPREDDLAFSALLWVPLTAPDADEQPGSHDGGERSRRLHLLLDAYRYDGDRRAFGAVIVRRARRQAGVIRSMADAGDRAAIALLPIASRLEQSAAYVEALPGDFWTHDRELLLWCPCLCDGAGQHRLSLMSDGPRLAVVAHPRSGSNTLLKILGCHPELTVLNEPFNENFSRWLPANPDYRAQITDVTSLDRVVDGILADYSGFKVQTYQLETELLAHMLRRRDLHVVFLRRRNLLEAVVSSLIAEQTGLWAAWDRDRALEDYYTDLDPLVMDDVRHLLRWTRDNLAEVAAILRSRGDGRALELYYEDLFLGERSARWQLVESVWAHLGLPLCENPRLGRLLEDASLRVGRPATYGRLPNLAEIEATLGDDETGHIGYLAP